MKSKARLNGRFNQRLFKKCAEAEQDSELAANQTRIRYRLPYVLL